MGVEKRKRGGRIRWVARWRQDGRQLSRTFDTERDAETFERERRRNAQLGAHVLAEPSRITLHEWLDRWWDVESPGWAPSTRRTQASAIDKWIEPFIGGVRLRDLGVARVRQWRADAMAEGCSAAQANEALGIFSAALGVAVRDGLLPANPCSGVRKLPTAITRPTALVPAEIERLRAQMPTLRDVVLVGLLFYAGLRPGEVLALRWQDVDRLLVVDPAVSDGVIRESKTNARRTVEIVEPVAEDIELHRPKRPSPDALAIAGDRGQVIDLDDRRTRVWYPARESAELTATPYDGRHSEASLLIHEGRSLRSSPQCSVTHPPPPCSSTTPTSSTPRDSKRGPRWSTRSGLRGGNWNGLVCTREPVRTLHSPRQKQKSPA